MAFRLCRALDRAVVLEHLMIDLLSKLTYGSLFLSVHLKRVAIPVVQIISLWQLQEKV
jgi:uncharacterized protein YwlG (UPF0340 family)